MPLPLNVLFHFSCCGGHRCHTRASAHTLVAWKGSPGRSRSLRPHAPAFIAMLAHWKPNRRWQKAREVVCTSWDRVWARRRERFRMRATLTRSLDRTNVCYATLLKRNAITFCIISVRICLPIAHTQRMHAPAFFSRVN